MSVVRIKTAWPPNIKAIADVLPVTNRNIFAYDRVIYNPGGGRLSRPLIEHEKVHFAQQYMFDADGDGKTGVEGWWERFLESEVFRLSQEIPAHKKEYQTFVHYNHNKTEQAQYLRALGLRLSAPMYGGIITANEAMKAIRDDGRINTD